MGSKKAMGLRKANARRDPIVKLPHEIILNVVERLSQTDRMHLRLSREWADFIDHTPKLWQHVEGRLPHNLLLPRLERYPVATETTVDTALNLKPILRACPIQKVYIDARPGSIKKILQTLSSQAISSIHFVQQDLKDYPEIRKFIKARQTDLQELSFVEGDVKADFTNSVLNGDFPNLRYLRVSTWRTILPVSRFETQYQSLETLHLRLYNASELRISCLFSADLHRADHLQRLTVESDHYCELRMSLPRSIRFLQLFRADEMPDTFTLPLLEELDVGFRDIRHLRRSLLLTSYHGTPRLRRPRIRGLKARRGFNDEILRLCRHPRLVNLQELGLIDIEGINNARTELEISHMQHLKLVDLTGSNDAADMAMTALQAPSLTTLNLSNTRILGIQKRVITRVAMEKGIEVILR